MPEERDEYGGVAVDAAPQVDEYGGQLVPERTMLPEVPRVPEEAGARIMGAGEPLLTLPRLEATDPRFQAFLTGLTGRPPSIRAAENVAAAANVAKTLPEFLTSPLGAATAPIAAAGGLPARLLGLGFAGQMAAGVPEAAREAGRVSVEGTPQEQKEALLGLGVNIALPAALAAPALARRGLVRPAPEEIRPVAAPVAPEAALVAPAAAPTPLTAAEQAAERARLASELGEEPATAAPVPALEPAPVPETPIEAPAPAKPEVAKLGDPSTKPNRFGDPAGTTYYATPEDWQGWQEHDARFKKISRDFIEAMRGGDPEKIAEAQKSQLEVGKEHEAFREKYGGMNPEPPKVATVEASATEQLSSAFKSWDEGTDPNLTERDLLDRTELAIENNPGDIPSALKKAAQAYRDAIEEDFEMAGRGDIEPAQERFMSQLEKFSKKPTPTTYTGADAIEIVGKPLGEWFKAKTVAELPKGAQRVELAGRIRAKSTKPKDILGALKNEQDRIRRVVTEMAKPPLSPEEAIPMVQPAPTAPTATETTPPVPAAEMPKKVMAVTVSSHRKSKNLHRSVEGQVLGGRPISLGSKSVLYEIEDTPKNREAISKLGLRIHKSETDRINKRRSPEAPEVTKPVEPPPPPTETPPQAGPVGMGAAVSEEFEHDPRTPTGIRNAIVDKERVKRGLPEAMQAARRSFGEVWDRAMALIDRDPTTQDELLNTLRDKPRALTDTEDALVLHRQIDLQNEYGKATRDLAQAFDDGRLDDVARERVRVASLADKLLDIYNIGKTSGTETARGLSARRMMANEDFTLARMVTEKRAANQGKPLTDAQNAEIERLNKIIERTQKALDDFQKREAERRGGGPPPTTPPRIDPELERIKADNERAKREYREGLARDRLKERTPAEKAMDWLVQLRQGFVLSGPTTLAKLVSAAIQRMVFTPTEEVVGAGLSKVIPSVASKAAREGGINARAEARALTEGFTVGMRDAWDVMRTGRSSLDIVYGKRMRYPMAIPGLKYIGFLHGALKSATKRNEFARSFEKRASAAIAQGVDVSDPFVQASIGLEAYKDANRSIFLQDNRVVTAYKAALATLEKRARDTGKTPLAAKSIATTGKILLPIVRVPTNIVAETLQYATGSVTGSARLARAFAKGIENLQPAEADIIMRNLKKGSIGAAVLALGYLNADVIGGYYEPGKRKPQDVPFGRVRVYGHDIPSYLLHNPLLETLQVGATLRRLAESKLSKKDAEAQGIGWGIVGAGMGLLEEVPFLRETVELAKTFRAGERRQFLGELLKSLTVPQGVQWLAATQDVDQYGQPISRKPKTLAESVKTGIPGLREEVPVRPPPKRTP